MKVRDIIKLIEQDGWREVRRAGSHRPLPPSGQARYCDECVSEMRKALAEHLLLMKSHGETLPSPSGHGVYVQRALAA